jgi:hypothetical protein
MPFSDFSSVKVHTREQRKPDGAWQGWYEWDDPTDSTRKIAAYELDLVRPPVNS